MPPESGEGYGILSVDEAVDDSLAAGLLAAAGFENVLSESGQGFYIDDFGALKFLPLDSYRDSLDELDPRDDGYGERLRSFFVRGGRRFFYIPLKDSSNRQRMERTAAAALGDLPGSGPFSLEILGTAKPVYWYFIIMAAVLAAAVALSGDRRRLVFQIPLLAAFAWSGAAGFVLAGTLTALRNLLGPPLKEFFPVRSYGSLGERLKPWKACLIFALFFPVFFAALCLVADVPPVPAAAGFLLFLPVEILTVADDAGRQKKAGHIRFIPVRILPGSYGLPPYKGAAAAFAAGAGFAVLFPLMLPAFALPRKDAAGEYLRYLPSAEDYREHMEFEASFSFTPLGSAAGKAEYRHYFLGDDGLIAGSAEQSGTIAGEFPPFPLEKLSLFLLNYYQDDFTDAPGGAVQNIGRGFQFFQLKDITKDIILVALMIIICIPNNFHAGTGNGKRKKTALLRLRRIAA